MRPIVPTRRRRDEDGPGRPQPPAGSLVATEVSADTILTEAGNTLVIER